MPFRGLKEEAEEDGEADEEEEAEEEGFFQKVLTPPFSWLLSRRLSGCNIILSISVQAFAAVVQLTGYVFGFVGYYFGDFFVHFFNQLSELLLAFLDA